MDAQEDKMNETALQETSHTSPAISFNREQIALIKRTIAVNHTDDELALFLNFCKAKRLDPFAREVYSIKRKDKATIQMGIDGLRARGEDTGQYAGQETHWCGADGQWLDVWLASTPPSASRVMVFRKDTDHPFTGIAKWVEYKPADNDFMWLKMPANQLAKCAEAQALRKAFPRTLGGIYVSEELQNEIAPPPPPLPQRKPPPPASTPASAPKQETEPDEDNTDPEPPMQRRMLDKQDAREMEAKFTAPCKACGKMIAKGEPILYIGAGVDKGAYHAGCAS